MSVCILLDSGASGHFWLSDMSHKAWAVAPAVPVSLQTLLFDSSPCVVCVWQPVAVPEVSVASWQVGVYEQIWVLILCCILGILCIPLGPVAWKLHFCLFMLLCVLNASVGCATHGRTENSELTSGVCLFLLDFLFEKINPFLRISPQILGADTFLLELQVFLSPSCQCFRASWDISCLSDFS